MKRQVRALNFFLKKLVDNFLELNDRDRNFADCGRCTSRQLRILSIQSPDKLILLFSSAVRVDLFVSIKEAAC